MLQKIVRYGVLVLISIIIILFVVGSIHISSMERTDRAVEKIHATKLTLDDVMGKNLPTEPGSQRDITIEGVDENNNGIRDDVELAIFKEYPNSAKTRAVLLQYALSMQMEVVQPSLNRLIVTEIVREQSRADSCLSNTLVPRKGLESIRNDAEMEKIHTFIDFVKKLQINTEERNQTEVKFYEYLGSYNSLAPTCDFDYSLLPN